MSASPPHTARTADLTALALVNVLLVVSAGIVDLVPMAVLVVLTAAAPWLKRLQGRTGYQAVWRIGILSVFAVLALDFWRSGAVHMLEDGLLLAAVSQVHILYNIGPRQRPDLLFLNSFVITLVTSFFAPGLSFSALFALYALAFVRALARGATGLLPDQDPAPGAWRTDLRLTMATLGVTAVLFFSLPRAFDREGLALADLSISRTVREIGFNPEVSLLPGGPTAQSNRIVMTVRRAGAGGHPFPKYWRGATQRVFTGEGWQEAPLSLRVSADAPWRLERSESGDLWTRRGAEGAGLFDVEQRDLESGRLLLPDGCAAVRAPAHVPLVSGPDGTLRLGDARDRHGVMQLVVQTAAPGRTARVKPGEKTLDQLTEAGWFVVSGPDRIGQLANAAWQGRNRDHHRVGAEICRLLAQGHRYVLPGQEGAAETFEDFLSGAGGGHCEFFATAAALALRRLTIPCRLATGYRASEQTADLLTVRARDAHAWVEVLDKNTGEWWILDPTPPSEEVAGSDAWYGPMLESLQDAWSSLVHFDERGRVAVFASLVALPHRHPIAFTLFALLLAASAWHVRVRRRRVLPAAVRDYLRHGGAARRPEETPRELLARLQDDKLSAATRAHERARYRAAAPTAGPAGPRR